MSVRLTQFSSGAGCGCKISSATLGRILQNNMSSPQRNLLVGNSEKDDCAAYLLPDNQVLLSTTDFFMPVVDHPEDFGRIAAANAISDIYAMGGQPILALSILGWPVGKLSPELANRVLNGAREIATACGISIAGGHSIDSQEPIFGLSVNGLVSAQNLKRNSTANAGDVLVLTKPLGLGIYTTAMKKGVLSHEHEKLAVAVMTTLNSIGQALAKSPHVSAMTDVTGFGLIGHTLEMLAPRKLTFELNYSQVPQLPDLASYIEQKTVPGGTERNAESFENRVVGLTNELMRKILFDPQTSGGLLIAVAPEGLDDVRDLFEDKSQFHVIGNITHHLSEGGCVNIV